MFEVKVKVKVGKKRPYEGRAANPVAAFPEVVWLQARVFLQSLAPMDECDKPMIFDWAVRYGEACSVRYVQTATLPRSLPAGSAPLVQLWHAEDECEQPAAHPRAEVAAHLQTTY